MGMKMGRAILISVRTAILLATTALPVAPAAGQPLPARTDIVWDFENGSGGWRQSGDAFEVIDSSQPLTTDFVRVPIGGDYWKELPYPLGHSGTSLVRSKDVATGTMTSPVIPFTPDLRYFSVLVGGTDDVNRLRVELMVDGRRRWSVSGDGPDQLHQHVFALPSPSAGQTLQVRLVDESISGHLLVDRIVLSQAAPAPRRVQAWGLADYHTHLTNYLAFGALHGVRAVWGVPGGNYHDYERDPDLIARDLPRCVPGHGGGPFAEAFINGAEGHLSLDSGGFWSSTWNIVKALTFPGALVRHPRSGAESFNEFPSFRRGLHYQMHITQIRRAFDGGLRLMTVIAVQNIGVEFAMSKLVNGATHPGTEREVLDAQVCAIRELAALNHDWMEIAYDPDQAREIIAHDKLAIVLGIEMDQLDRLDGFDTPADTVDYLWKLGIRQVTPIHAIDNDFGGAAVFEPAYNALNDLLHREEFNMAADELSPDNAVLFDVEPATCASGSPGARGECVTYYLPEVSRAAIVRVARTRWRLTPFLKTVSHNDPPQPGVTNKKGLHIKGELFLRALIDHGMLLGTEHMSTHTVEGVHTLLGTILAEAGHEECRSLSATSPRDCFNRAYPLNVSHAHFRQLSDPQTQVPGYRPSEYEVSDSQAEMVRLTGGFVGQFTAEDPIDWVNADVPPPFHNDCAGSSKSFAYSYAYALRRLGGRGVGLATDFTIISGTAPRFGKYACWSGRPGVKHGVGAIAGQYGKPQQLWLAYSGSDTRQPPDGVTVASNAPLVPYRMGQRTYDFNVDGLAHYGLVPDLLQDITNLGATPETRRALFNSGEDLLQTWEKAARISGVAAQPFVPAPLPCEIVCRGLCPQSAQAGAPQR